MKKLSKRFLTLAIACVMAMMMAVPAFAIGNPTVSSGRYKIYPNGKTTFLLNVRGYGTRMTTLRSTLQQMVTTRFGKRLLPAMVDFTLCPLCLIPKV